MYKRSQWSCTTGKNWSPQTWSHMLNSPRKQGLLVVVYIIVKWKVAFYLIWICVHHLTKKIWHLSTQKECIIVGHLFQFSVGGRQTEKHDRYTHGVAVLLASKQKGQDKIQCRLEWDRKCSTNAGTSVQYNVDITKWKKYLSDAHDPLNLLLNPTKKKPTLWHLNYKV